jgi:hypothetical protein
MPENLNQEFFDLLLYLLTSSRVAIDEPKRYGSFRLFEAFGKLLDARRKLKELPSDNVLEKLSNKLEKNRQVTTSSSSVHTKEYAQLLDRLIEIMAEEITRRDQT